MWRRVYYYDDDPMAYLVIAGILFILFVYACLIAFTVTLFCFGLILLFKLGCFLWQAGAIIWDHD